MKQKILFFAGIFLIASGCEVLDKLTQFQMDFHQTITISSSTNVNLPFNVMTPDIETNSSSDFTLNDTRKDMIEKITLEKLTLTLKSPSNGDLGFIKSLNISMVADSLPEIKVAWIDQVPENTEKTIDLDVSGTDLQEYIKKDKFSLRVNTVTDELIASDHKIDVHSVFYVDAKILGQ